MLNMPVPTKDDALQMRVLAPVRGITAGTTALVELSGCGETVPALRVNGHPVEPLEAARQGTGAWRIIVPGLAPGRNRIEASTAADCTAIELRGYPAEGPIISGPHLKPWKLTTQENGLGTPLDEHGNAPPRISHVYMSLSSGDFEPYDPANPPAEADVAIARTDAGVEVKYIVRHERGAANRGIYELAVLCDPTHPLSAVNPPPGWNGKLWIYLYGGWNQFRSQGVLAGYDVKPPIPAHRVLLDMGLRRGFMIARTTLAQSATNSDSVRGAESLIMLKDHVTRAYGPIRYTLSSGTSGGSIMQQMVANQYPGLIQGIMPLSSIHGSWYLPGQLIEAKLLDRYFTQISPALWSDADQRLAVDGHGSQKSSDFFNTVFDNQFYGRTTGGNDPTRGTDLPDGETYHPRDRPAGARGTLQDYQVNYLGCRDEAQWGDAERAAGHGFAPLPWANVGVQYGLGALLDGRIGKDQFLDLNEKIGGVDIDQNFIAARNDVDPQTAARMHRGGFANDFAHLSTVAILDVRPPETGDLPSHTQFHTWVSRTGLVAAQGHADNQVACMVPGYDSSTTPPEWALLAMDRWLAAIEADDSEASLAEKVVANKPAGLCDGVYDADGNRTGDLEDYHRLYPSFGDAKTVAAAGDLRAHLIVRPRLKPLDRCDYPGIDFDDGEWARLLAIFPDGVADWAAPGVGQARSVPWLSYAEGPGGQALQP
ncbi:DUF6351 family protein [Sphingomonas colocasiae]|uniref:DUF6351 family protein n=1 Tax=Sphingomonas colocasiae TaxID=1848973 RepID=A0ABS7PPY9_9SPHN|nr:DUF6351 family protein [Sphingomonas colocasiae]MBY8823389.1 DUF6351 family protein [Sphingomonas colocasiae]